VPAKSIKDEVCVEVVKVALDDDLWVRLSTMVNLPLLVSEGPTSNAAEISPFTIFLLPIRSSNGSSLLVNSMLVCGRKSESTSNE